MCLNYGSREHLRYLGPSAVSAMSVLGVHVCTVDPKMITSTLGHVWQREYELIYPLSAGHKCMHDLGRGNIIMHMFSLSLTFSRFGPVYVGATCYPNQE